MTKNLPLNFGKMVFFYPFIGLHLKKITLFKLHCWRDNTAEKILTLVLLLLDKLRPYIFQANELKRVMTVKPN